MPDICFFVVFAYKGILLHSRRQRGCSSHIWCAMTTAVWLLVYLSDPYRGGEEAQPLLLMPLHVVVISTERQNMKNSLASGWPVHWPVRGLFQSELLVKLYHAIPWLSLCVFLILKPETGQNVAATAVCSSLGWMLNENTAISWTCTGLKWCLKCILAQLFQCSIKNLLLLE